MIKKYWKLLIVIIIILVIGAGVYYRYYNQNKTNSQEKIDPGMIMEVEKGRIEKTIEAEGFIEPINETDLSFPASGSTKIKKIYVVEGDKVEKGQLLMELDQAEAKLRFLQKKNQYNRAKINGSKSEIEEARLDMEMANDNLQNMKLIAPFAGIITEIYVENGDYYTSGYVATIKDISRLKVEVNIEESNIPDIKLGQRANIILESLPGKTINGKVTEIEDEANNAGGTVTLPVVVTLDRVNYDIKLGCSVSLDIIVGEVSDKVLIPITAIISRNGRGIVMKVVDGKQQPTPVRTGLSDGLKIAIESGLKPGDKIIINTFRQPTGANIQNTRIPMRPGMFGGGGRQ